MWKPGLRDLKGCQGSVEPRVPWDLLDLGDLKGNQVHWVLLDPPGHKVPEGSPGLKVPMDHLGHEAMEGQKGLGESKGLWASKDHRDR